MDAKAKRVIKAAQKLGVPHDPQYGQGARHDYWVQMLRHAQPIPSAGIGTQEVSGKISFLKELLPRIKNDQGNNVAGLVDLAIQHYVQALGNLKQKDQRNADSQSAQARQSLQRALNTLTSGRG